MPNQYGQVVEEDYFAPKGTVRVIAQSMEDGEVEIVADFISKKTLDTLLEIFLYEEEWVVADICNSNGMIRYCDISDDDFDEDKEQSADLAPFLVYSNTEYGKEFIGFFHHITWAERMRKYYDLDIEIYEQGRRIY